MPSLYYRVEAPGVNILKPITEEVVTGLLDELDLVRYFENAVYILSSFTAYSQYDDGAGMPTLNKNRCDVNVEYIMDKSQVPWPVDSPYTTTAYGIRTSNKGMHTPVLIDQAAGIFIEHYTVACAINMEFKLTFKTFDDACKAFDTIKSRYVGTLIQIPFDLSFSYPVSMSLYNYLMAVYQAKTDYANKTLLQYLKDMGKTEISYDVRKSQIVNPNADVELMIRCQQLNSVAQLTMDQKEPEVYREEQLPSHYTLSFDFVVQFGRPNLIVVNTPISVDNKVLPYYLFENTIQNFHYNPFVSGIYQDLTCQEFMARSNGNFTMAHELVRIPSYDDWWKADQLYANYGYRPFIIAHFTLDGPTTTINIATLDDITLHPVLQDIMSQTGSNLFDYGGLFHIGVWANNLKLGDSLLSIDSNLNLTITSNRTDLEYHLVISETTNIQTLSPDWNALLIKYRYFFPMTIERNIQTFINKKIFYIDYDNSLLNIIDGLLKQGLLKALLTTLVSLGEDNNEIFSYTQNASQLADYMAFRPSQRHDYTVPTGTDPTSVMIQQYYSAYTSIYGRSVLVAFLEQCLIAGYTTLATLPTQYLDPNATTYPYAATEGGFYGFNTPFRVANYIISPKRNPG